MIHVEGQVAQSVEDTTSIGKDLGLASVFYPFPVAERMLILKNEKKIIVRVVHVVSVALNSIQRAYLNC